MKRINIIGSISTILALGLIVYINMPVEEYKDTYKPRSQPVDTIMHKSDNILYWEWDSVMDSVNMDCGE
jgi:hypothetical protein